MSKKSETSENDIEILDKMPGADDIETPEASFDLNFGLGEEEKTEETPTETVAEETQDADIPDESQTEEKEEEILSLIHISEPTRLLSISYSRVGV